MRLRSAPLCANAGALRKTLAGAPFLRPPRRRGRRRAMGGYAPPLGAVLSRMNVAEDDAAPPLRPAHAALLARALQDATLARDWPRAAGASVAGHCAARARSDRRLTMS